MTTLVVVRDADVRALIREMLKRRDSHVLSAGSEAEAFHVGRGARIDLLLVEAAPDFDGRAIAERFRAQSPSLPVIYVTRYDDAALDLEGATILTEPFSRHDLANAVAAVLDPDL